MQFKIRLQISFLLSPICQNLIVDIQIGLVIKL